MTLLAPSWDSDVNPDGTISPSRLEPASVRLLEMATILTSGNQFYMHNGNHLYLGRSSRWCPASAVGRQLPFDVADDHSLRRLLTKAER